MEECAPNAPMARKKKVKKKVLKKKGKAKKGNLEENGDPKVGGRAPGSRRGSFYQEKTDSKVLDDKLSKLSKTLYLSYFKLHILNV